MILKSTLTCATAIAIALTSFNLTPAAAAPRGGPAIATQDASATDFSAARKRRRGNAALPLAAFGAIAGTIAGIAAANSRRDYYERPYYAPRHYYGGPAYGYEPYAAPPVRHGYYGHRGFRGPAVHGPNQAGDTGLVINGPGGSL